MTSVFDDEPREGFRSSSSGRIRTSTGDAPHRIAARNLNLLAVLDEALILTEFACTSDAASVAYSADTYPDATKDQNESEKQ